MHLFPVVFTLILAFSSCCIGSRKCKGTELNAVFRIVDNNTNDDLVFGTTKVYDKNKIKFFSINGVDTILHRYTAGPNTSPGQDSLLFVAIDYSKLSPIYLQLNSVDIDTLMVSYPLQPGSNCCPEYSSAKVNNYNTTTVSTISNGVIVLKK